MWSHGYHLHLSGRPYVAMGLERGNSGQIFFIYLYKLTCSL